jgi:hypothetical protein
MVRKLPYHVKRYGAQSVKLREGAHDGLLPRVVVFVGSATLAGWMHHACPLVGRLWEMRMTGRDGISRAVCVAQNHLVIWCIGDAMLFCTSTIHWSAPP